MNIDISYLTFIATQAALRAGEYLKKGFGTSFQVKAKTGKHNPVTEFDQAAEELIISCLKEHFSDHAFLAEESGASHSKYSSILWIIDPLDGTLNFSHNIPIFTVSIAAYFQDEVLCGIIYQPMTQELFVAQKGKGAYLNGQRLKVSPTKQFEDAILVTAFPYELNEPIEKILNPFTDIIKRGNPVRELGSAALHLAYVAAGRFDAYWIARLHPWDIAAGKLMIEEAGGNVSHYDGSPYDLFSHSRLLATNGFLDKDMVSFLKNY